MKTALITGVSGQDGAYLSRLLLDKGYRVVGITRSYKHSKSENLRYLQITEQVILEECDLLDVSSILHLIKKYQPDEIYNLSAQSSVGLSFEQPIGTIQYNITSVLNLLESIRILDISTRFYQASSSEMFGRVETLPITLETPMHPLSPYGISKATAFWTSVNYRESYGLYVCNGILFNHESYLRSSNFFVKKVIKETIKISNREVESLKVGNIDIKRDFGFAPRYVEAMWLTLQKDRADDYIICSGLSVSLREIIYYVFKKFNVSNDRLIEDPNLLRPNEIKDIYGDNSLSKQKLDWDYSLSFFEVLDLLIEEELTNLK